MNEQKLKSGDVVKLKSGGPLMTIDRLLADIAVCRWFNERFKIFEEVKVSVIALEKSNTNNEKFEYQYMIIDRDNNIYKANKKDHDDWGGAGGATSVFQFSSEVIKEYKSWDDYKCRSCNGTKRDNSLLCFRQCQDCKGSGVKLT